MVLEPFRLDSKRSAVRSSQKSITRTELESSVKAKDTRTDPLRFINFSKKLTSPRTTAVFISTLIASASVSLERWLQSLPQISLPLSFFVLFTLSLLTDFPCLSFLTTAPEVSIFTSHLAAVCWRKKLRIFLAVFCVPACLSIFNLKVFRTLS